MKKGSKHTLEMREHLKTLLNSYKQTERYKDSLKKSRVNTVVVKKCEFCSEDFSMTKKSNKWKERRFCSNVCYWDSKKGKQFSIEHRNKIRNSHEGKNAYQWKGGKPKCKSCEAQLRSYKAKECRLCFHKRVSGENSPRWVEDRTQLKMGNEERRCHKYKIWRRRVCNRDGWNCKINNKDCRGRLEVHHILGYTKFPELRYEINNGITLCHFHHPRVRKEEKRLSPYFQELVSASSELF